MWLVTKQGFYSVVEHRADSDKLIVRCRAKGDLEALKDRQLPELDIFYDDYADYPWRAIVRRVEFKSALLDLASEIDYDNFKNAVTREQGKARHDIYMSVWSVLLSLNERKGRLKRAWGSLWHDRHDREPLLADDDPEAEFHYFPSDPPPDDDPFIR